MVDQPKYHAALSADQVLRVGCAVDAGGTIWLRDDHGVRDVGQVGTVPGQACTLSLWRAHAWPWSWWGWRATLFDLKFLDSAGETILALPAGGGYVDEVCVSPRFSQFWMGLYEAERTPARLLPVWRRRDVERFCLAAGLVLLDGRTRGLLWFPTTLRRPDMTTPETGPAVRRGSQLQAAARRRLVAGWGCLIPVALGLAGVALGVLTLR